MVNKLSLGIDLRQNGIDRPWNRVNDNGMDSQTEVEKLKATIAALELCLAFGQECWVKSYPRRRDQETDAKE